MTDAMHAEFGTLAEWTAEVALELGLDYHIPAGCRGSGSPAALDWLLSQMHVMAGDVFLDCGAGVGGPAAYAARARSVHPVLIEPEAGGCRAAKRLFGYPTLQAEASALPSRTPVSTPRGRWESCARCRIKSPCSTNCAASCGSAGASGY